ncbi:M48 family metallopeptidase [Alloalcanivorax marinus]|uniref:M48 family metallopeptidase n=1 Tax=Alloalcanivorax marinus TaxID=1177169 RepID=UPI0019342168|nr:SprT family zinc-dependent metalloprotease [Alloalcanivorax marinus]MBL7251071.1 M48 family metallopeptidase [Alloalcanivorax marinus]
MEYELVRSRRRSLEVRVFPDGHVQVRAPQRLALRHVRAFVDERRGWIEKQQRHMAERPRQRWRHGDHCAHLGDTLSLELAAGRRRVARHHNHLRVTVPDPDDERQVSDAVHEWWRAQARPLFQARIEALFPWFAARGHDFPVLRVKKMRTRWGSLSQRGYINLSLLLMQYPLAVIDYVVMHELCHLEHMNHGPDFHALMDRRMPDWRRRKMLLEG